MEDDRGSGNGGEEVRDGRKLAIRVVKVIFRGIICRHDVGDLFMRATL